MPTSAAPVPRSCRWLGAVLSAACLLAIGCSRTAPISVYPPPVPAGLPFLPLPESNELTAEELDEDEEGDEDSEADESGAEDSEADEGGAEGSDEGSEAEAVDTAAR